MLLRNHKPLPALNCIQYNAEKICVTEDDVILANKRGFGSKIGSITNRITAMTSLMANYEHGSQEYETLRYRTQCGQAQQQAEIDKAKGIVSNPMPKSWYIQSENRVNQDEDSEEEIERKKFYQSICADKKPYFFIYNYQSLKKEYDSYMENIEVKSQSMFESTFKDLCNKAQKTDKENQFIKWVNDKNPIDISPSVMNKICWAVEKEFDELALIPHEKFDYSMLKSGHYYSKTNYYDILDAYNWYKKKMSDLGKKNKSEYYDDTEEDIESKEQLMNLFIEKCSEICPNEYELCDILVDLCYSGKKDRRSDKHLEKRLDKEIVWTACGETIIKNLLKKNNGNLYYPQKVDSDGEFECCGGQFVMTKLKMTGGEEE